MRTTSFPCCRSSLATKLPFGSSVHSVAGCMLFVNVLISKCKCATIVLAICCCASSFSAVSTFPPRRVVSNCCCSCVLCTLPLVAASSIMLCCSLAIIGLSLFMEP